LSAVEDERPPPDCRFDTVRKRNRRGASRIRESWPSLMYPHISPTLSLSIFVQVALAVLYHMNYMNSEASATTAAVTSIDGAAIKPPA
jgi:hypothetical protein